MVAAHRVDGGYGDPPLAALRCGRIIERIGHIRSYAAFAGLVAAATAAMALMAGPLAWLVLRAIVGFGLLRTVHYY